MTPTGVELNNGEHHELDVLICATGYDASFQYPFDVVGRGGKTLQDRWNPHPEAYLAMNVDGFPNLFFIVGPNLWTTMTSIFPCIEAQVDYVVAAALKMQRERLKSMEVQKQAVMDFNEYAQVCPKVCKLLCEC